MKLHLRQSSRRKVRVHTSRRLTFELMEPRLALALTVPAFSSLPGANHTVYLDFDGHVTTGTSWNNAYGVDPINSPAYSTDADNANFSATELANIEKVWKRVTEDFAPFQVNVTTVAPPVSDLQKSGTGDTRWGIRVVMTKDVAFGCGCGGIAYINSFNWSSDTPTFVFNSGEIGAAEAASHEVGHSLGLSHDGTSSATYYSGHGSGATSWAPIMGVGYYVSVSQFDKGEYFGSNNKGTGANYSKGPDDLQIITTYNGFGYKTDDHGNSSGTASPLSFSGTSVSGSGLITTRTDVDYFQFSTGGGTVNLNINPAALGANLDISASLFNSLGQLITTSNPSAALNAAISQTLAAGQYFLAIDGVGVGNPTVSPPTGYTDYASIGVYSISGSITPINGDVLSISATDASKNEGQIGITPFTFTVNRTGDTSGTSTANFTVSGSGGAAAAGSDFVGGVFPSGTLTFGPGVLSQTITINIQGDSTNENSEGFTVSLIDPGPSTSISTGSAAGTIVNDDVPPGPPTLSISATDAAKAEGTSSSPTPFVFTISRAGNSSAAASVKYTVAGTGNRKANGSDFVGGFPKNVVVSFAPGQTSAEITLNVLADSTVEHNETFKVTLSGASGASIANSTATGSILNDDVSGSADDEANESNLIAVADPLWAFVPAEHLTAEQLAVPVMTWINGVPHVGDRAHEHEFGEWHDDLFASHDEFENGHGDFEDGRFSLIFALPNPFNSGATSKSVRRGTQVFEPSLRSPELGNYTLPTQSISFATMVTESSSSSDGSLPETLALDSVFQNWNEDNDVVE